MIEYSSYTCPFCAFYHSNIYPKLEKDYINTGKIAYVMREFVAGKQDLYGGVLARCGGKKKFDTFVKILFAQQGKWTFNRNYEDILINIGQIGGIMPHEFSACLKDEKILNTLINNTREINVRSEFIGTPTFFINQKKIPFFNKYSDLVEIIEQELKS